LARAEDRQSGRDVTDVSHKRRFVRPWVPWIYQLIAFYIHEDCAHFFKKSVGKPLRKQLAGMAATALYLGGAVVTMIAPRRSDSVLASFSVE
jgi:hypothetical protein